MTRKNAEMSLPEKPSKILVVSCFLFFLALSLGLVCVSSPFITFDFFDLVSHGSQFPGLKTFVVPKDSFYYRPVLVMLLTKLYQVFNVNFYAYHVVFSALYGLLGCFLFLALARVFSGEVRKKFIFYSCVITLFLSPLLWEIWYFSDSEPLGALFMYVCVFLFFKLQESPKSNPTLIVVFFFCAFLSIFSKETSRAAFVLVFLCLLLHKKNFSKASMFVIPLVFLLLTVILPKFFHGLTSSPKPSGLELKAFLALHTVFQLWHPFGMSAVLVFFFSVFFPFFSGRTPLRFLLSASGTLLCVVLFPEGAFFQYFETVTFPSGIVFYISFLSLMFMAALVFVLRSGTQLQKTCAKILLGYLVFVLYATLYFPYARMDSSSRNFISVFPFFSLLWVCTVVPAFMPLSKIEKAVWALLFFMTFLHISGSAFNLASRVKAQASVEWSVTRYLSALDLRNTLVIVPDNLYPILPDNLEVVTGKKLPGVKFFVSSSLQSPFLFQKVLRRVKGREVWVYYWRVKPLEKTSRPVSFWTKGYNRKDNKVYSLVRMNHPAPMPLERFLNKKTRKIFYREAAYIECPRFFEDFYLRIRLKEPFCKRYKFMAGVYELK